MSTIGLLIEILWHRYDVEQTEVISVFYSLLLITNYKGI